MNDENYNGWSNHETWNIALWLYNNEDIYRHATKAVDIYARRGNISVTPEWAKAFVTIAFDETFGDPKTPDGVDTNNPKIDWNQISQTLSEFSSFDLVKS
jgi:hypothetical protein